MNKFEQLIEYVINDEQDKAQELFHEIVVEKSRSIYEDIMAEEELDEAESVDDEDEKAEKAGKKVTKDIEYDDKKDRMKEGIEEELGGSEAGDLIDDIETEEEGISLEAEDMDDEMMTVDMDDDQDKDDDEDLEDRVVDLEDKLDELMAEFEELMGDVDVDGDGDHDMDDHKEQMSDEEEETMDVEMETEGLEENVSLEAAPKPTTTEQGADAKSPVAANSGAKGMDAKPVHTDQSDEKGRKAPQAKDMGGTTKPDMKAAPKPVTAQASGVNNDSPIDG